METLPTWCASVARILTTTEQLAHHPGFQAGNKNNSAGTSDNIKDDNRILNDEESGNGNQEIVFNQSNPPVDVGEGGDIFTAKRNGERSNRSSSDASDI